MIKINQIVRNLVVLELIFILMGFSVCKAQDLFPVSTDSCDDPVQARTELVISGEPAYESLFSGFDDSKKQIPDFAYSHIGFSSLYKASIIEYHNYVVNQLSAYAHSFTPNRLLIAALQKHTIWHQLSDDPLFSVLP